MTPVGECAVSLGIYPSYVQLDTYTAQATFGDVRRGITNHKVSITLSKFVYFLTQFQNLESSNTALLVFGNGDGGGGPLNKMLENLRRIRAAANVSRDIPVVHMGTSVEDFFLDVERDTKHGETLPNWHGELYLEFHRGTYTSHGELTYKITSPHPNCLFFRFYQKGQ
jgi:alpha-mannosidase